MVVAEHIVHPALQFISLCYHQIRVDVLSYLVCCGYRTTIQLGDWAWLTCGYNFLSIPHTVQSDQSWENWRNYKGDEKLPGILSALPVSVISTKTITEFKFKFQFNCDQHAVESWDSLNWHFHKIKQVGKTDEEKVAIKTIHSTRISKSNYCYLMHSLSMTFPV